MSPKQLNLLIDHLDQTLGEAKLEEAENLIRNDESSAEQWKLLQFTVANIREAGLYEQITAVRNQYKSKIAEIEQEPRSTAVVLTMSRKVLRIAAVLLAVSVSAAVFKFISVSNTSIYNDYYSSYNLSTTRAAGDDNALDNAYREKKWNDVITMIDVIPDRTSKHFFLEGVANLELEHYPQAITSFKLVLDKNSVSGDDYFNDEAEYYLAMSYLANKEGKNALKLLEIIKKDRNHLYYNAVNKIGLDLTILQIREGK